MTRDATAYISNRTLWMLTRVVRAMNEREKEKDVPEAYKFPALTTDKLADEIISEWIAANHPKLVELWDKRAAIDNEALNL